MRRLDVKSRWCLRSLPKPSSPSPTTHHLPGWLIGSLREIHDQSDRAVFDAYGWPHTLTNEQILERVVALNAERRTEEAQGLIRWLRPEYQAPNAVPVTAQLIGLAAAAEPEAPRRKQPWPSALPDQVRAVKDALRAGPPQNAAQIAAKSTCQAPADDEKQKSPAKTHRFPRKKVGTLTPSNPLC